MTDWQHIETAKKERGLRILVADATHVWIAEWYVDRGRTLIADDKKPYWEEYDNSSWMLIDGYEDWFDPTHWLPLPSPPSQEGTPDVR